jgi:hypothetical protein
MGRPNLPNEKGPFGTSPVNRSRTTKVKGIRYEIYKPTVLKDRIPLKAAVEPIWIKERTTT